MQYCSKQGVLISKLPKTVSLGLRLLLLSMVETVMH